MYNEDYAMPPCPNVVAYPRLHLRGIYKFQMRKTVSQPTHRLFMAPAPILNEAVKAKQILT